MLFGKNPEAEVLLAILGLKENDVERFRDVHFCEEGISIYTRTGGGNRDDYKQQALLTSPYYIRDEDDDYDCTYATFYFRIPEDVKEDVEAFKNARKNGISGKLIQWILKTLEREPTKDDLYAEVYSKQRKAIQGAKLLNLVESNGHTVVPLDDCTLNILLKMSEDVGGEELAYSVRPYKITVKQNVSTHSFGDDVSRVKISLDFSNKKWEIDRDEWNRWQQKFGEKYPKSIAKIAERIN